MKGTMKSEGVIVSPMEVVGTPPKIRREIYVYLEREKGKKERKKERKKGK